MRRPSSHSISGFCRELSSSTSFNDGGFPLFFLLFGGLYSRILKILKTTIFFLSSVLFKTSSEMRGNHSGPFVPKISPNF